MANPRSGPAVQRKDRHMGHVAQVRFPENVYEVLDRAAEAHDVTINWLVNKAVRDFLAKLLPPDEVKWTRD